MAETPQNLILATLTTLYVLQGVLYGIQTQALPVMLRMSGASHTHIGCMHLVAFPWIVKSLWAPFVDCCASKSRCLSACLWGTSLCLLGAQMESRTLFLTAMFMLNLFSATTDMILCQIQMLTFAAGEIPRVSSLHIIGYKTGTLFGGGLLLWITAYLDETKEIFPVLSAVYLILGTGVLWSVSSVTNLRHAFDYRNVTQSWAQVRSIFKTPGSCWITGCVCVNKLTSYSSKTLFFMLLIDRGFSPSYIGIMSGIIGQLVSIAVASGVGLLLGAKR